MRLYNCVVLLLLVPLSASGQDYERVDATIQLYPEHFDSPEAFSAMISRDFISEEEKVRGIYTWIIQNVAYDPEEYKKFNYTFKNYRERNTKEEKTRKQLIKRTLSTGIAVCEGYAMLFEKICSMQGISTYLVRGDIKTNFDDIGRPFRKIHMWNVAVIDGQSYLFDPTWGAGKYHGKFIKEPTYFFYKTPPNLFVKTHYPDIEEDTLLPELITREVFSSWPLIILEELTLDDVEKPISGIIDSETSSGEVYFNIRIDHSVEVAYSFGEDKIVIATSEENGVLSFSVPFQLGQENLLIYFDDKPALGFKIK